MADKKSSTTKATPQTNDKSVLGLILATVGLFSFVALLNIWGSGTLMIRYANFMLGVFGCSALAISVIVFAIGAAMILGKRPTATVREIVRYSLLLLFVILFLNVLLTKPYMNQSASRYLAACYNNGVSTAGGVFFALFTVALSATLGYTITLVIVTAVLMLLAVSCVYDIVSKSDIGTEKGKAAKKTAQQTAKKAPQAVPVSPTEVPVRYDNDGLPIFQVDGCPVVAASAAPDSTRPIPPVQTITEAGYINKPRNRAEAERFGLTDTEESLPEHNTIDFDPLEGFDSTMRELDRNEARIRNTRTDVATMFDRTPRTENIDDLYTDTGVRNGDMAGYTPMGGTPIAGDWAIGGSRRTNAPAVRSGSPDGLTYRGLEPTPITGDYTEPRRTVAQQRREQEAARPTAPQTTTSSTGTYTESNNTITYQPTPRQTTDTTAADTQTAPSDTPTAPSVPRGEGRSTTPRQSRTRDTEQTPEPEKPKKKVKKPYVVAPTTLFTTYAATTMNAELQEQLARDSAEIERIFESFKIPCHVVNCIRGPSATRFELKLLSDNVNLNALEKLAKNITSGLQAPYLVKMEQIWGTDRYGIEVAHKEADKVGFREILESDTYRNSKGLSVVYGKKIEGDIRVLELQKMPHLLVAGATGYGKSVFLNVLICSLIYKFSPDELRLILIDPKKVEMKAYNGLPHLLTKDRICTVGAAVNAFNYVCKIMDERYTLFEQSEVGIVKNIEDYNRIFPDKRIPYIVVIVDELAELMIDQQNRQSIETAITRITQLARAAGIHLVLATQRPSVDIITGVIKNNMPARISFKVTQNTDSRTILDRVGADQLVARGDSLFLYNGELQRVQSAFISDDEIQALIDFVKANNECEFPEDAERFINATAQKPVAFSGNMSPMESAEAEHERAIQEAQSDPKFWTIVYDAVQSQRTSTTKIQTKFGYGYGKATKIVDAMESMGIVSALDEFSKSRKVLMTMDELMEKYGEYLN